MLKTRNLAQCWTIQFILNEALVIYNKAYHLLINQINNFELFSPIYTIPAPIQDLSAIRMNGYRSIQVSAPIQLFIYWILFFNPINLIYYLSPGFQYFINTDLINICFLSYFNFSLKAFCLISRLSNLILILLLALIIIIILYFSNSRLFSSFYYSIRFHPFLTNFLCFFLCNRLSPSIFEQN